VANDRGEYRPYVTAVVLTWNDAEMASGCIRSVLGNTYPSKDVILVDNGSDPAVADVLGREFPSIEVLRLDENQGFTGGCNRGIERAIARDADYVFLLNNDTVVHEAAIEELVDAAEARPDAAAASALILLQGAGQEIQFYKGVVHRDAAHHVHPGEGERLDERHRTTVETEFAPACALLLRTAALREVGLFDEGLFTNWEDYDLCCRFLDAGWRLITAGRAEVVHAHGQTTGRISPFITYFFTRNRLICLFRYGRPLAILRKCPFILRTFFWQVRAYGFGNWPAHRAFLKGILHFLLGVRGGGKAPGERRDRTT